MDHALWNFIVLLMLTNKTSDQKCVHV